MRTGETEFDTIAGLANAMRQNCDFFIVNSI
jgi:hypothetical protein